MGKRLVSKRLLSTISFTAVLLACIPVALELTMIHRAPFPHATIERLGVRENVKTRFKADSQIALSYRISFSLLVGHDQGHGGPITWEIQQALQEYFDPTLQRLQALANFSVDSQVLYHSRLSSTKRRTLSIEDLRGLHSANDWNPTSILSNDREKGLHFMIFLPGVNDTTEIVHEGKRIDSFLVPRWGGIYIMDHENAKSSLTVDDLYPAFQVFIGQFSHLLDVQVSEQGIKKAESEWLLHHIESTTSTLRSLAKLINDMPHMTVLDRVSQRVEHSLEELDKAETSNSLLAARRALQYAEEAFFDPTLVPQLYFRDEHLYAVHLPLLLPVFLPVIMALNIELRRFNTRRKENRTSS